MHGSQCLIHLYLINKVDIVVIVFDSDVHLVACSRNEQFSLLYKKSQLKIFRFQHYKQ